MQSRTSLNRQITVAGELNPSTLQELARGGFASVVDLRTPAEFHSFLSPESERERLSEFGLEYMHIPVAGYWVDDQVLEALREAIARLPKPLLVHCSTGRRAGLLTLTYMGIVNGWSAEETLERAAQMGFHCDSPALEDAIRNYLRRSRDGAQAYCSAR